MTRSRLVQRHTPFLILLFLFFAFRLLTIFLFRPGGFITDFSDYDFYYEWGVLTPMGYHAYDNLWTAYPPLFPVLMLTLFEWSSRIPPWVEPRLFFHLIFGTAMVLFECGNFICIYWLGRKLALDEGQATDGSLRVGVGGSNPGFDPPTPTLPMPGLWPAILYGFLFTPVYTMAGWFEPMPLFFMLVGLCLLLSRRPWWILGAVAAGLGFLTKLTPILLLPIAVRWFGAKLSVQAARSEWFRPRHPGNLLRPVMFLLTFAVVVVGVGYPLVNYSLDLAFSSFQVQNLRPPWQSIWALWDGYYGWGLVPLSMRNLEGLSGPLWETNIPWTWIGAAFVLLYLYLYTRAFDWSRVRTPIAFAGLSVTLLFLYSKGWSPQFLVWILVFIVLLAPTPRWIAAAVCLSVVNLIESTVYFIMLPTETYLLQGTVILRTLLLLLFAGEMLAQLAPKAVMGQAEGRSALNRLLTLAGRGLAYAVWVVLLAGLIAGVAAFPRAAVAYRESRLAQHPCPAIVGYLQGEVGTSQATLITQQPDVWREFYPWLGRDDAWIIVDGYDTRDQFLTTALARLDEQLATREFWWIQRTDLGFPGSSPPAVWDTMRTRADVFVLETRTEGTCRVDRVVDLSGQAPVAEARTDGGNIWLRGYAWWRDGIVDELNLVLYWQADRAVAHSYTVFVHLVDEHGGLVGQQDNLPVRGLAPTHLWEPGQVIRDPYVIIPTVIRPAARPVAAYVGLYNAAGRVDIIRPDGTIEDYLEIRFTEFD